MIVIYGLVSPAEQDQIRYVGKTNNPTIRLSRHLRDARNGVDTHKDRWIRSLLDANICPEMVILAEVVESDWEEVECRFITDLRQQGHQLTNSVAGGRGGKSPSDYSRYKMSKSRLGRKILGRKRIPHSVATRLKISASHVGLTHSDTTKKKMSESKKGRTLSDDHKHKISKSLSGRVRTTDIKLKISESKKGKKFSDEHKRKLSDAAKR